MNERPDWFDPYSPAGILLVIFGATLALKLATDSPLVLLGIATIVFLGWVTVRTGIIDGGTDGDANDDPFTVLQRRYANGDITEAEFERRVDRLLNAETQVDRDQEPVLESDR